MRKGSISDVLWLMFTLLFCLIVMTMQMSFSGNATIDSYSKNIVNEEVTSFVNKVSGYSTDSGKCNMFNLVGERRVFGGYTDVANGGETASANAYVNKHKEDMVKNIKKKFEQNKTLNGNIDSSSLNVDAKFVNSSGTTMVSVEVSYRVGIFSYTYNDNEKGPMKKSKLSIPQKVSVVRAIENPLVFK